MYSYCDMLSRCQPEAMTLVEQLKAFTVMLYPYNLALAWLALTAQAEKSYVL
ncbi:hypothetical protein ACPV5U_28435 [Vibrio mediterranei]